MLAIVITCAVAVAHAAAAAQQSISSDLRMLIMQPGSGPFEPKAGPPPADFPREVLPRGTDPGASGVSGNRTIVVGTLSGRTAAWRTELLSAVSSSGWVSQMPLQTGFVRGGESSSVSICKSSDFVDVSLSAAPKGGTNVRAMLTRDPRRVCAPRGAGSNFSFADVTFPVIELPSAAKMLNGGGGGSNSEWSSHAQVTTDLSLEALAEHVRRQIVDAGWTEDGSPAFLNNAMVIRFKAPSTLGPPLPAMLIVTAFDVPQRFDLLVRVARPPER